jgi:hypothetical protein
MSFEITPVTPTAVVPSAEPAFLQFQQQGAALGAPNVRVVNFISPLVATRGVGEHENVLTVTGPAPATCTLQTGPFDFYDNFTGDGPLASRVATPGPGSWSSFALGNTLDGMLGVASGVTDTGGNTSTITGVSNFIEVGFMLSSSVLLADGVSYVRVIDNGGGVTMDWTNASLLASLPFSELQAAGPGWDTAWVGKEVVLRLTNSFTGIGGRVAVCDNNLQSFFGTTWGTAMINKLGIFFHPGVFVSHVYAKWG